MSADDPKQILQEMKTLFVDALKLKNEIETGVKEQELKERMERLNNRSEALNETQRKELIQGVTDVGVQLGVAGVLTAAASHGFRGKKPSQLLQATLTQPRNMAAWACADIFGDVYHEFDFSEENGWTNETAELAKKYTFCRNRVKFALEQGNLEQVHITELATSRSQLLDKEVEVDKKVKEFPLKTGGIYLIPPQSPLTPENVESRIAKKCEQFSPETGWSPALTDCIHKLIACTFRSRVRTMDEEKMRLMAEINKLVLKIKKMGAQLFLFPDDYFHVQKPVVYTDEEQLARQKFRKILMRKKLILPTAEQQEEVHILATVNNTESQGPESQETEPRHTPALLPQSDIERASHAENAAEVSRLLQLQLPTLDLAHDTEFRRYFLFLAKVEDSTHFNALMDKIVSSKTLTELSSALDGAEEAVQTRFQEAATASIAALRKAYKKECNDLPLTSSESLNYTDLAAAKRKLLSLTAAKELPVGVHKLAKIVSDLKTAYNTFKHFSVSFKANKKAEAEKKAAKMSPESTASQDSPTAGPAPAASTVSQSKKTARPVVVEPAPKEKRRPTAAGAASSISSQCPEEVIEALGDLSEGQDIAALYAHVVADLGGAKEVDALYARLKKENFIPMIAMLMKDLIQPPEEEEEDTTSNEDTGEPTNKQDGSVGDVGDAASNPDTNHSGEDSSATGESEKDSSKENHTPPPAAPESKGPRAVDVALPPPPPADAKKAPKAQEKGKQEASDSRMGGRDTFFGGKAAAKPRKGARLLAADQQALYEQSLNYWGVTFNNINAPSFHTHSLLERNEEVNEFVLHLGQTLRRLIENNILSPKAAANYKHITATFVHFTSIGFLLAQGDEDKMREFHECLQQLNEVFIKPCLEAEKLKIEPKFNALKLNSLKNMPFFRFLLEIERQDPRQHEEILAPFLWNNLERANEALPYTQKTVDRDSKIKLVKTNQNGKQIAYANIVAACEIFGYLSKPWQKLSPFKYGQAITDFEQRHGFIRDDSECIKALYHVRNGSVHLDEEIEALPYTIIPLHECMTESDLLENTRTIEIRVMARRERMGKPSAAEAGPAPAPTAAEETPAAQAPEPVAEPPTPAVLPAPLAARPASKLNPNAAVYNYTPRM